MSRASAVSRVEFWSNCEYTGFLQRIVELLNAEGWQCSQRYLISHTAYRGATGRWSRMWLRLKMYGIYPLYLAGRVLFDRSPAILVISTNTFYAPAVTLLLRSRKHKVIHLIYDLFPESFVHAGMLKEQSLGTRLLNRLQAWTFRHSDANVFLGERLQEYVLAKHAEVAHPTIIPVGANETPFADRKPVCGKTLDILYCGNMGYMHDPDCIEKLIRDPGETIPARCCLSFHASGKGYARFKKTLGVPPDWVSLQGFLGEVEWVEKMRRADIALILMGEGAENILMPSKVYSALVAGQAILAIAPTGSDLATIISTAQCGWLVQPGDVNGLRATLERVLCSPDEVSACQRRAQACGRELYSGPAVARQWNVLFTALTDPTQPAIRTPEMGG